MSNFILNVFVEEGFVGFEIEISMVSVRRYKSNWSYCSNSLNSLFSLRVLKAGSD